MHMKLSVVVCTYGRFPGLVRLVESIRKEFSRISFEIVVVASDQVDSEKCMWAESQSDIRLVCVGDRYPGEKRTKSLYFYENIGIQEARGDWVFITNDDSEFEPGSQDGFLEQEQVFDVLVLPAELDDPRLGKRAPVIGYLELNGSKKDLLLLDFAFIKRDILHRIGPSDESLDWYGAGADRAVQVALLPDAAVGVLAQGGLTHHLEQENRTPPHSFIDFTYLSEKWKLYEDTHPEAKVVLEGLTPERKLPLFYHKKIWPMLASLRSKISHLRSK